TRAVARRPGRLRRVLGRERRPDRDGRPHPHLPAGHRARRLPRRAVEVARGTAGPAPDRGLPAARVPRGARPAVDRPAPAHLRRDDEGVGGGRPPRPRPDSALPVQPLPVGHPSPGPIRKVDRMNPITYAGRVTSQREEIPALYGDVDFSIIPERYDTDATIDDERFASMRSAIERVFDDPETRRIVRDATMTGDRLADAYAALIPA